MKRMATIAMALVALVYSSVWSTIINIPGQYPTIQQGIDATVDGDTVLVQPGTYVENIIINGKSILLGSLFLTTADTSYISQTIICGDSSVVASVVNINSLDSSLVSITGFTIQNGVGWTHGGGIRGYSPDTISIVYITDNIIKNNAAHYIWHVGVGRGGGISLSNIRAVIERNRIFGNSANWAGGIYVAYNGEVIIRNNDIYQNEAIGWAGFDDGVGGGIYIDDSNVIIEYNNVRANIGSGLICVGLAPYINCNLICGNTALSGGGIICDGSDPLISNNVISENEAEEFGGGISCHGSHPVIKNTIVWSNYAQNYDEIFSDTSSTLTVSYSNIQDTLWPGPGNISADPLFRDPDNGDFHLMSVACGDSTDSPCIDTGDPNIPDILLDCSWGLGTILSDMGAYGGGDSIQVGIESRMEIPVGFSLSQNYPNPFNASTSIKYDLSKACDVTIEIYDILGRRVATLIREKQQAGRHSVVWNADGISSGMYLYGIQAGRYREAKRMVLLK